MGRRCQKVLSEYENKNVGNDFDRSVALKPYPIMGNNFRVSERSKPFPTIIL